MAACMYVCDVDGIGYGRCVWMNVCMIWIDGYGCSSVGRCMCRTALLICVCTDVYAVVVYGMVMAVLMLQGMTLETKGRCCCQHC